MKDVESYCPQNRHEWRKWLECFGWIDSVKKTVDTERYKQYFTKRKERSNWSKVNKKKVEALIERNLMREAGYKSIEVAKANGSWEFLDDIEALVVPEDLQEALTNRNGASEYFDNLSASAKKVLLHWVASAKRSETRQRRIFEIAENAGKGCKPKQFR
jgi:uncharacterized protein YdeI (YjbR/CyaY-like superfamily)